MPPRKEPRTIWDILIGALNLLIELIEALRDRRHRATHFVLTVGAIREKRDP
jgi:hypothetical protein